MYENHPLSAPHTVLCIIVDVIAIFSFSYPIPKSAPSPLSRAATIGTPRSNATAVSSCPVGVVLVCGSATRMHAAHATEGSSKLLKCAFYGRDRYSLKEIDLPDNGHRALLDLVSLILIPLTLPSALSNTQKTQRGSRMTLVTSIGVRVGARLMCWPLSRRVAAGSRVADLRRPDMSVSNQVRK